MKNFREGINKLIAAAEEFSQNFNLSKFIRKRWMNIFVALSILFAALYPNFVSDTWLTIGATFFIFALVALSQDIVLGRAGVYDMGHAIYFGMGAYIFAIATNAWGLNFFAAATLASFAPVIFAMLLSAPVIHLRGDYFLVVSIALNIIFVQALNNNIFEITGGPNGIFGIYPETWLGIDFTKPKFVYYYAFIVVLIVVKLMHNFDNSRYGRAVCYIYQDELAALSMGINPNLIKLLSFAFSAVLAGFAGVLYTLEYGAVAPEIFKVDQSIIFFAIVIVGGQGSLAGVLLGTFVMFVLPELFRGFAQVRYLVFGLAMVVFMILRPNGLIPTKYGFYPKKLFKLKGD
ncbi:MAG: branched-chain amino acid ABC transporter permease [Deferribacteraceae bacterium]|jgi:branched-chain amino acid transport system permease protein|nr:branched-chain amino acid ABC transporter permease [Deferribacteraceae bacterium]